MAEYIKGNCPHCKKPLEIPDGLEKFSCLYCGMRTSLQEMLELQNIPEGQYEAELEYLKAELPNTVINYPNHYRKMTKKEYIPTFKAYEAENKEIVKRIDTCAKLCSEGAKKAISQICADLIEALESYFYAQPRWQKENKRNDLLFETRVVLAIFLTPLVKKLHMDTSEMFRRELNRQWLVKWPEHKWTPGDYQVLEAGYSKKGLCYITTALCRYEGKDDDCEQLQAFRNFRDGWLRENGGQDDIALYYEIAPVIVACMDYCDDTDLCYAQVREKWLAPCYEAIVNGRNDECRKLYTQMVRTLQNRYMS